MQSHRFTDPMGSYRRILDSLYSFTPANRQARQRGILEAAPEAAPFGMDDLPQYESEGGFSGDTGGWGNIGLPGSNTDLGIPASISPQQAFGIVSALTPGVVPGLALAQKAFSNPFAQRAFNSLFGDPTFGMSQIGGTLGGTVGGFGGTDGSGGRGGADAGHGGSAGGADGRGSPGGGPDGSNEGGAATGGY